MWSVTRPSPAGNDFFHFFMIRSFGFQRLASFYPWRERHLRSTIHTKSLPQSVAPEGLDVGSADPSPPRSPRSPLPFVLLVVLGVVSLLAAWRYWPKGGDSSPHVPAPPPPAASDPRLSYATPYRNVRPDVAYVGDEACAGCHA